MNKFEAIEPPEPRAGGYNESNQANATISIAISLKRIADMMEHFIDWQSGPEALPK